MSLAGWAIKNRAVTYFAVVLLLLGGVASFFSLGQLEDPDFTIKTAVIVTSYPGATPEQVEQEITDRIELALQEISEVDYVESTSQAGYSSVKVEIQPNYTSEQIPQIWDAVRRKVRDVEGSLPPGAGRPQVSDDFGDVFGHLLAIQSDGFSYAELEVYAEALQRELRLVEGVARVDLWGVQDRAIYIDINPQQLAELGISDTSIENTLQAQNLVVDAGSIEVMDRRLPMVPSGEFERTTDIEDLFLTPSATDLLQTLQDPRRTVDSAQLIRIGDIAEVREGYRTPPSTLLRHDGLPAIALAIANQPGVNVVEMGRAIDERLAELIPELPIGIELNRIHWQSDIIDDAVSSFLISLAQAVAIVLVVVALFMGWRLGIIIGTGLILTILGTFVVMALFGIDLHRMSLGALIIALGMMVDNAIVVADGYVVRRQAGADPDTAARESASSPSLPLLGATIVAVLAFYPIAASEEAAGEYCAALFSVVGISLLISWILSMTVTPLQCADMLRTVGGQAGGSEGRFYSGFRSVLKTAIRFRFFTVAGAIGLLVASVVAFGSVSKLFFPDSSMTKFMIDYWAPEGTRIEQVSADIEAIEAQLATDERIESVSAFVGAGPPRFYLPVDPEPNSAAYGQVIVNVHDYRQIDAIADTLRPWLAESFPDALVPVRPFGVGPSNTWKFEARFSGPSDAAPAELRRIAEEATTILRESPLVSAHQTDWRQRTLRLVPEFDDAQARWTGVTREDVGSAMQQAFDGRSIGLFRDGEDFLPIMLRFAETARQDVGGLDVIPVRSSTATDAIPLAQVIDELAWHWEDPKIQRRDRRRTITVQANPVPGTTLPELHAAVLADFQALAADLPPGYSMEWGGEFESSRDSQASLIPGVVPAVGMILLILVALFNAYRPPLVIVLTIPFVVIGISWGLLVTGAPFGFVALLGAMSLSGMMIKNAIVLLDEINANLTLGKTRYQSIVDAAVSRLRPVGLAAATTVLGVIPLLQDVFWIGMAVTIMAGLSFGTLLTMALVPVLYAMLHGVREDWVEAEATPPPAPEQTLPAGSTA